METKTAVVARKPRKRRKVKSEEKRFNFGVKSLLSQLNSSRCNFNTQDECLGIFLTVSGLPHFAPFEKTNDGVERNFNIELRS